MKIIKGSFLLIAMALCGHPAQAQFLKSLQSPTSKTQAASAMVVRSAAPVPATPPATECPYSKKTTVCKVTTTGGLYFGAAEGGVDALYDAAEKGCEIRVTVENPQGRTHAFNCDYMYFERDWGFQCEHVDPWISFDLNLTANVISYDINTLSSYNQTWGSIDESNTGGDPRKINTGNYTFSFVAF